jgi:cytochrome c-type biogenesis protein CcmH
MGLFWIITIFVTLIVAYVVIRPMTRSHLAKVDNNDQLRVSIYKENLQELETEVNAGEIDTGQLENVKNELELSLLLETSTSNYKNSSDDTTKNNTQLGMALITGLILVGLSMLIYNLLGNPQLITLEDIGDINSAETWANNPDKGKMISMMETHLQRNPEDANGLYFLANIYLSESEFNKAVSAFERLHEFIGDNTQVLLAYADTLVRLNEGRFSGKASELIHQVLSIEPDNYSALFFAGLAAEETENYREANGYYSRLIPILENQPQLLETVNTLIAQNKIMMQEQGVDENIAEVSDSQISDSATSVQLRVTVVPGLIDQFSSNDTLFIYAQPLEGRPMPLAVIRTEANSLPMEVTLDDKQAMMPTHKISDFEIVRVQARISKSGTAEPSSGDLLGVIEKVNVADTNRLELVINQIIP